MHTDLTWVYLRVHLAVFPPSAVSAVSSQLWVTPRPLSSLPYNDHCVGVASFTNSSNSKKLPLCKICGLTDTWWKQHVLAGSRCSTPTSSSLPFVRQRYSASQEAGIILSSPKLSYVSASLCAPFWKSVQDFFHFSFQNRKLFPWNSQHQLIVNG